MTQLRIVLTNCSPDEAEGLAKALVEERLAACVNVLPGVRSFFVWQGEFCDESETTLFIKTTAERYDELAVRLRELHSYDTPEIVALEPTDVLDDYLTWAAEQTR